MIPWGFGGRAAAWAARVRPVLLLGLVVGMGRMERSVAHDRFAECLQQRYSLRLQPEHIDVTVEFTFFELASAAERRQMDRDGDGRIQRAEVEGYCRELGARLTDRVELWCGGRRLDLMLLRDPEVDLLGDNEVRWAHHDLTLRLFAKRPSGLVGGEVLEVRSCWWPEWPAQLTAGEAVAGPASAVQATGDALDPAPRASLREGEWRRVRFAVKSEPSGRVPSVIGEAEPASGQRRSALTQPGILR